MTRASRIAPALAALLLAAGCASTTAPEGGSSLSLREQAAVCAAIGSIGVAVVDGRRSGLTQAQQLRVVDPDSPLADVHRAHIRGVYSVDRPRSEGGWTALRLQADRVRNDACRNAFERA